VQVGRAVQHRETEINTEITKAGFVYGDFSRGRQFWALGGGKKRILEDTKITPNCAVSLHGLSVGKSGGTRLLEQYGRL